MSNLIQPAELQARLGDPDLLIVDTRFALQDKTYGRQAHAQAHLPGAVYLDLETDLSGPPAAHGGRHPLPDPQALALTLGRAGLGNHSKVVVYDDAGNMYAVRLWWMLRWLGHTQVHILDGGYQAWVEAGYAVTADKPMHQARPFVPVLHAEMLLSMQDVRERLHQPGTVLLDARSGDRYRGEVEPIDAKAGHIPGARNRPFKDNLTGNTFKSAEQLRQEYLDLGLQTGDELIVYCGSGVTACHNLLALEEAGIPGARLYAGSWSDWSSYDENPIETSQT